MNHSCPHCHAKLFNAEINTSTCCQHSLTMPAPYAQPLPNINALFENAEFQKTIRGYNNALAFTSIHVNYDRDLMNAVGGVYTFKICGRLHHMMGPLHPSDGKSESFSQIYILDPDEQTRLRMNMNGGLEPQILI